MVFLVFCYSIHFTTFSRQCEYSPKVGMHYILIFHKTNCNQFSATCMQSYGMCVNNSVGFCCFDHASYRLVVMWPENKATQCASVIEDLYL